MSFRVTSTPFAPAQRHPKTQGVESTSKLSVCKQPSAGLDTLMGLPRWLSGKEAICKCRRHGFSPWVRKIPWRRKWQPTPVFSPGESHGQRSPAGYTVHGVAKRQTGLSACACTHAHTHTHTHTHRGPGESPVKPGPSAVGASAQRGPHSGL